MLELGQSRRKEGTESTHLAVKVWVSAEPSQAHRGEISFPSSFLCSRHISGVGLVDPELSGAPANPALLHLHAF